MFEKPNFLQKKAKLCCHAGKTPILKGPTKPVLAMEREALSSGGRCIGIVSRREFLKLGGGPGGGGQKNRPGGQGFGFIYSHLWKYQF